MELVGGVTIGILVGDLFISQVGSGTWQIVVVVALAMAVAVFLDDDMEIEPGWLPAVLETLGRTDRDVYFGPVEADFEGQGTPSTRAHGAPDGRGRRGVGCDRHDVTPR